MIEILPETEAGTFVVTATEALTHQDYQTIFISQIERRLDKFGKIRLLFHLGENFKGWE